MDHPGNLPALRDEAAARFEQRFGAAPAWIAAAPGRVNLIGEHTDYTGGFVLPMAVERYTVIAAAPLAGKRVVWASAQSDEHAEFSLNHALKREGPGWVNYVTGVMQGFIDRGVALEGFAAFALSTVPIGGGLSSSASLEVSAAMLLQEMTGHRVPGPELAALCRRAEHEFAGVPCGIMDQYICVHAESGRALLLDCRDLGARQIPVDQEAVSVLITDSGVKHDLADGMYADRRKACEEAERLLGGSLRDASMETLEEMVTDLPLRKRARHVVSENERTRCAAAALAAADWEEAGRRMHESHLSLRDDFEVSCRELDVLVDLHQSIGVEGGVYGCRMTGGGFGGCTVALVRAGDAPVVAERVTAAYRERTGLETAPFTSRPAPGALALRA